MLAPMLPALIIIACGAAALLLALGLLGALVGGFLHQLAWSMERGGIVGLALYVVAWIIIPVVMLVLSVVGGLIIARE